MSTVAFDADLHTARRAAPTPPEPMPFPVWYGSRPVQETFRRASGNQPRHVIFTELRKRKEGLTAVFLLRVSPSLVSPQDKFVEIAVPDHVLFASGHLRQVVIR